MQCSCWQSKGCISHMLYDSLIHTYLCDFFAEEVKHGCRPIINNVWFSGKASPVQCRGGHCLGMGVKVGAQEIHNSKECVEGLVEILILKNMLETLSLLSSRSLGPECRN